MLISILVPALNERENIQPLYDRVCAVFDGLGPGIDFELVVTDNHSDDGTFEAVSAIAARDGRVKAYRFARNFGYQRSIFAAYLLCTGEAAIQLDADLQDPPELIPAIIERWRQESAAVVYGVRVRRQGESRSLTLLRRAFYRLINWLSEEHLPHDAGDFRLVDRRVIELLRRNSDANPYIRGAIAASGFHQVGIEYQRAERTAGKSKFNLGSLFSLALDGILNHSVRPLHLASLTALVTSGLMLLLIPGFIVGKLVLGQQWPAGYASLAMLQLMGILLNALFLGIIGAYLGRIFKQVKAGPAVIIERSTDPALGATALSGGAVLSLIDLSRDVVSRQDAALEARQPAPPPAPNREGAGPGSTGP